MPWRSRAIACSRSAFSRVIVVELRRELARLLLGAQVHAAEPLALGLSASSRASTSHERRAAAHRLRRSRERERLLGRAVELLADRARATSPRARRAFEPRLAGARALSRASASAPAPRAARSPAPSAVSADRQLVGRPWRARARPPRWRRAASRGAARSRPELGERGSSALGLVLARAQRSAICSRALAMRLPHSASLVARSPRRRSAAMLGLALEAFERGVGPRRGLAARQPASAWRRLQAPLRAPRASASSSSARRRRAPARSASCERRARAAQRFGQRAERLAVFAPRARPRRSHRARASSSACASLASWRSALV